MSPDKRAKQRLKPLSELREIARQLTRKTLVEYELPDELRESLVLGTFFEPEHWVFELYRPGPRPEDAQVISRVRVNALTGEASIEVFLPKKGGGAGGC